MPSSQAAEIYHALHMAVSTLFVTTAGTETLNGTSLCVTLCSLFPSLSQKLGPTWQRASPMRAAPASATRMP